MGVIYKAICLITKLSYIGQTKNSLNDRKKQHIKAKDDYDFHIALKDFGEDNFIWEVIEECDDIVLSEREKYWISYYDTYYNGYNMTPGGENADALLRWKKNNPDKVLKNALNGLEYANKYLKEHREEHLKQLAEARTKGINAVKKKVKCIEKNLIFDSLSDAERWSMSKENDNGKKASHQHIAHVCKGTRKTCGGYHWEYV